MPQTSAADVNLGLLLVAAGIVMMVMTSARMLNVEPHELNVAIHFVGMLLITVWMMRMSTVSK